MQNAEADPPKDKRRRDTRPERITVGDSVFVRNDVVAAQLGETVRTLDKRDRSGAPFAYFGGVKYRPMPLFNEHIVSTSIRSQRPLQQPKRRRR
jgi:hypothetical protein